MKKIHAYICDNVFILAIAALGGAVLATSPAFAATPNAGTPGVITAANTAMDGTGATGRLLVFTAGANGSVVPLLRVCRKGTGVKTVLRVWLNNGSDPEVATNNSLIKEAAIPAGTADADDPNPAGTIDVPLNVALPANWRLYCTIGTAVADGVFVTPLNGGNN